MKNSFSAVGRVVTKPERKSKDLVTVRFVVDSVRNMESDMYFTLKFWDHLSKIAESFLTPGRNIFITGELTLREINDKQYYDIRIYNFDLSAGNKAKDAVDQSSDQGDVEPSDIETKDGKDIPF